MSVIPDNLVISFGRFADTHIKAAQKTHVRNFNHNMMFLIERQTVCRLENATEIVSKKLFRPFRSVQCCCWRWLWRKHTRVLFHFLVGMRIYFWAIVSINAITCMHASVRPKFCWNRKSRKICEKFKQCLQLVYAIMCVQCALMCWQSIYLNIINTDCSTTEAHIHTHSIAYVRALCLQR